MSISLDTIHRDAPGLVDLAKTAAVSLEKNQLAGEAFAVYLVLDHSGSMTRFYQHGDVQRLAEQALGLAVNLDDDGIVPLIFFGSKAEPPMPIGLISYRGIIGREHPRVPWGTTDYAAAMRAVTEHYWSTSPTDPALVIFQTDGEPDSRSAAEAELRATSGMPIFWSFVGFGSRVSFLEGLDHLDGRQMDNAGFFHAADPDQVSDADLYTGIVRDLPAWLTDSRAAGIVN